MNDISDNKTLTSSYTGYQAIYADGSKTQLPLSAAAGIYIDNGNNVAICWKLHSEHTVVAAELFAIKQALVHIKGYPCSDRVVVLTDSMTSCQKIVAGNSSYAAVVTDIKELLYQLNKKRLVVVQWVRAHCEISGNEAADKVAKLRHMNNRTELYHLETEEVNLKLAKKYIARWNQYWKTEVNRTQKGKHLASIQDNIQYNPWVCLANRKEEVILARLCTGHAATEAYRARFSMIDSNLCVTCATEDNIEHVLLDCQKYLHERNQLIYNLRQNDILDLSVKLLLGGNTRDKSKIIKATLQFLRQTGLIDKL